MLMLPVRILPRQCMRLPQKPALHIAGTPLCISTITQNHLVSYGIQQKRFSWWPRPVGLSQQTQARPRRIRGTLLPTDTARTERLNTAAGHTVSSTDELDAIVLGSSKHHDLESFLQYAAKAGLDESTNVYRGTHFEYSAAKVLQSYGFSLHRTGRTNDLGIDLLGRWKIPMAPHDIKIVAQCKATQTRPAFVRELEGACQGAPLGFRGSNVMALLIADRGTTTGVRDAVQRSNMPMGFMLVTADGFLEQFIWNAAATDAFLTGMEVTTLRDQRSQMIKFSKAKRKHVDGGIRRHDRIALLWDGKQWKP